MSDDTGKQQQLKQSLYRCRICDCTKDLRRCSKCKIAFYCSQLHQQSDWRRHKSECRRIADSATRKRSDGDLNDNQIGNGGLVTSCDQQQPGMLKLKQDEQQQQQQQQKPQSAVTELSSSQHHSQYETDVYDDHQAGVSNVDEMNVKPIEKNYGLRAEYIAAQQPTAQHSVTENTMNSQPFQLVTANDTVNSQISAKLLANQSSSQNRQTDKEKFDEDTKNQRHLKNLSDNTMRICDDNFINVGHPSAMSNDDLCKNIINDLNTYGLSVVDDFLGMNQGLSILNEVHRMYATGMFQNGQLVSNTVAERDLKTIRGDKITWVKGTEPGCTNIGYLINQVDNVVISANRMKNNGTLGNYKIRERTKAMVACYPGSGSHYVMHVDNPNKDGRVITAIYYLNLNWDTKRSGGILRIFPEHGATVADIEPKFDRIIFFWSDRRNPHEVQPAHRTRYAITVWYFDADEREMALNRYRQYDRSGT